MRAHRILAIFWVIFVLSAFAGTGVLAGDVTWNGGGADQSWFNTANWNPDSLPTSSDNAYIYDGGTAMVDTPGAVSCVLYVGNGGGGTLSITDGGHVTDRWGDLGYGIGSTGIATVSGAGSTWSNTEGLFVGYYGSGTLNITNGGLVSNGSSFLGYASGSTGTATVNGPGSTWTNGDELRVGGWGDGTLSILNGGEVFSQRASIATLSGVTGAATVDGSTWTNSGNFFIGGDGSGPGGTGSVAVQNYGVLYAGGTLKLWNTGTLSVDRGTVVAGTLDNGSGGTFSDTLDSDVIVNALNFGNTAAFNGSLQLGHSGGSGFHSVGAGQSLSVGRTLTLGDASGSTGTLSIADDGQVRAGALWLESNGTLNMNGGTVIAGTLALNPGSTFSDTSSSQTRVNGLIFGEEATFNGQLQVGHAEGSAFGQVDVGAGQRLSVNDSFLSVGYDATGILTVTDGGQVSSRYGNIGQNSGSIGEATVSGAGSTWTNSYYLRVGGSGSGTLNITNGGQVSDVSGYLGYNTGGTGEATVSGAGSTWTNSSVLYVGDYGSGTLSITDGGQVTDRWGDLGYGIGSTGIATVSGSGSTWSNTEGLFVGNYGSGTLSITDGGLVSNGSSYLGYDSGSTGTATVNGPGSTWTNGDELRVGGWGDGTLSILNGGEVFSQRASIATLSGVTGAATVGGGAVWDNSGSLYIGGSETAAGGDGSLQVQNGAAVSVGDTLKLWDTGTLTLDGGTIHTRSFDNAVGSFHFYDGTLTVSGGTYSQGGADLVLDGRDAGDLSALVLDNAGLSQTFNDIRVGDSQDRQGSLTLSGGAQLNGDYTRVGNSGQGSLTVSGEAKVTDIHGYLGLNNGGSGSATVEGTGSQWISNGVLYVGSSGTGELNVSNGGYVYDIHGSLGQNSGATGSATVDGAGSTWRNYEELIVGNSGQGALTVSGGAKVTDTHGYLGFSEGGSGSATVEGGGSQWTNQGVLYVGSSGGGELNVRDGGYVYDHYGVLGYNSGATGSATVDGAGSAWSSYYDLTVGKYGSGELNIVGGGRVADTNGYLGSEAGSQGVATVGGGAVWDNSGSLYVGGSATAAGGSGTLTVQEGGAVNVAGTLKVWDPGKVSMQGGRITTDGVVITDGGIFDFLGGEIQAFTIDGDLVNTGGRLAPGASPGLLTITGDYTQLADAFLEIELGGLLRGDAYDALVVSEHLSLAGTLEVVWYEDWGFDPGTLLAGTSFDILDWGSLTGVFDTILLPELSAGLVWDLSSLYADGNIFITDGGQQPVPEPSTILLLASGLLAAAGAGRRTRRHGKHV